MADNTFRVADETPQDAPPPSGTTPTSGGEVVADVPYLDYHQAKGHPFVADHYQLGDTWSDPTGGFPTQVEELEGYIEGKIKSGEIGNSANAVKNLLKSLERVTNMDKESRAVVKLETLSAYVEFLRKTDKKKYGYT